MLYVANLRKEYTGKALDESTAHQDPLAQFKLWFEEAMKAKIEEPNIMTVSSVSEKGRPSSRVVLLKGVEEDSFVFFTNYHSKKAREMLGNVFVSLNFLWKELARQVRVEGRVSKISEKRSDEYFQSRPKGSQIGAWASPQSEVIPGREWLDEKIQYFQQHFQGKEVPRPPHWGGFAVLPEQIEFWQGRPNRLHDRILYSKENNDWKISRLAP